jgi:ADP-ribose pyrophosphatase YjhB (NUDIX family)
VPDCFQGDYLSHRNAVARYRDGMSHDPCEDSAMSDVAENPPNPPGIRLGAAPTIRVANKAIIVRDDQLLVTVNTGDFPTFYLCPGGGQDHGEDAYEALRRECREEIGCEVVVGELAFVRDYIAADHEFADQDGWAHQREAFFSCELAPGAEPQMTDAGDLWQTGIAWLPLDCLRNEPLWPKAVARGRGGPGTWGT